MARFGRSQWWGWLRVVLDRIFSFIFTIAADYGRDFKHDIPGLGLEEFSFKGDAAVVSEVGAEAVK